MNPPTNPAPQQAQTLASQLGSLAGRLRTQTPLLSPPRPLSLVLAKLRRGTPEQEHASKTLKANEFLVGD